MEVSHSSILQLEFALHFNGVLEKIHLTRYVHVLDTIPIQHVALQQSARPHRPIHLLRH